MNYSLTRFGDYERLGIAGAAGDFSPLEPPLAFQRRPLRIRKPRYMQEEKKTLN